MRRESLSCRKIYSLRDGSGVLGVGWDDWGDRYASNVGLVMLQGGEGCITPCWRSLGVPGSGAGFWWYWKEMERPVALLEQWR